MNVERRYNWQEIRNEIQNRILNRELVPGDKLPKDEELAEQFGCARTTVQRAMRDLADKGTIVRKRKGGTHVMRDPVTRVRLDIPITRLEVEQTGAEYSYQFDRAKIDMIPEHVADMFELSQPEEMLNVKALHLADGVPYIFEDRWVSKKTVAEILDVNLHVESANEWLIRNKPYDRCDIHLYAVNATAAEARKMQIEKGKALFVIERTTWINGAPITSVRALTRPGYQMRVGI